MNEWPKGHRHAMTQSEHKKWNATNYPGTRQLCCECDEPTGNCEDDSNYFDDIGPLCWECYENYLPVEDKPKDKTKDGSDSTNPKDKPMSERVDLKYARQMAKEMHCHYNKKPEVGKLALMNAPQLYLPKAAEVINQLCQEVERLRELDYKMKVIKSRVESILYTPPEVRHERIFALANFIDPSPNQKGGNEKRKG